MKHWSLYFLLYLTTFIVSAAESTTKAPVVTSYSENVIRANIGDHLYLEVAAAGENLKYSWIYFDRELCRESQCAFDTSDMGSGENFIDFFVSNEYGEVHIKYRINFIRNIDKDFKKIFPKKLTSKKNLHHFDFDQYYVTSNEGLGYILNEKQVQKLHPRKQKLDWSVELRTNFNGHIEFGKDKELKCHLLSQSVINLVEHKKQKFFILKKGILSVDLIENPSLDMLFLIDNIQISSMEPSHFHLELVETTESKILYVTVLKGRLQAVVESSEEDASSKIYKKGIFPQGSHAEIVLNQATKPITFMSPFYDGVQEIVYTSHPEYTFDYLLLEEEEKGDPKSKNYKKKQQLKIKNALETAKNQYNRKDYFAVIDALRQVHEFYKKDLEISYLLGRASKELYLFDQAKEYLKYSRDLDDGRFRPAELIAHMNMSEEEWDQGAKFLSDIPAKSSRDPKVNFYYLGVAHYKLDHFRTSRRNFYKSLRQKSKNKQVDLSSKEFIKKIEESLNFMSAISIDMLRNSNPFSVSEDNHNGRDIYWKNLVRTNIFVQKDLFLKPYGSGALQWDTSIEGYEDKDFPLLSSTMLKLPILIKQDLNRDPDDNIRIHLGVEPKGGFYFFNSSRSYDVIGNIWKVGFEIDSYKFDLSYENTMYIDPDPNQLKAIDPLTHFENSNLDLGGRYRKWDIKFPYQIHSDLLAYLTFQYLDFKRRYIEARLKTYSDINLFLDLHYDVNNYIKLMSYLHFTSRDYYYTEPRRTDNIKLISFLGDWEFSPFYFIHLGLDLRLSDSSVQSESFSSYQFFLGYKYIF